MPVTSSTPTPLPTGSGLDDPKDFSFVLGGPLFNLLRKGHLADNSLGLLRQRLFVLVLLSWLPLLILSAMAGEAWGPATSVPLPFLRDLAAQLRSLLALPLMIIAEQLVHRRIRPLVNQFRSGGLVPKSAAAQFDTALASAERLRGSVTAELLIIAFVYVVIIQMMWRHNNSFEAATWFATPTTAGKELTLAGYWYGYFTLPLFQFLLMRWYYRLFIWARFLLQVSRINLNIIPTHPDGTGGLEFISLSISAFIPLIVAHGVMLSGLIADRIFYGGATLPEFKFVIGALVVVIAAVMIGPLMVFAPQLARAKRKAIVEYGALGQRYVQEFDTKWIRGGASQDEPLVGSADVQSLADLGNSYEIVKSMATVPLTRALFISVVGATLLPILPLILTMMPLAQVLKLLMGMGM
jgi:hypothetical protein